jgi:hypothetical protein
MPTCVEGHQSTAIDYCDVCGAAIGGAAAPPVPAAPAAKACPACGMPVVGRFCESCGHDSALPAPPAPVAEPVAAAPEPAVETAAPWSVTVAADREFYERVLKRDGPDTVAFPDYFPFRRIPLTGESALIGRGKPEQGITPEIDLGVRPADRGVSSQHAVLRVTDAGLTITDLGSTNGTTLNGSEELLAPDVEVPLSDGDRIHVGAWTTITVAKGA